MVFSSNIFLFFFLPFVITVYYLFPRGKRNLFLLVSSLFFYGWGEPVYVLLMAAVIVLDYFAGLRIAREGATDQQRKGALIGALFLNLALLAFFKYTDFLVETVNGFLPAAYRLKAPHIPLPIGISFYIFQSMSYLIDLWRGQVSVQRNPVAFGTYVALFPQLIAGPIVRYRDIETQLRERRESVPVFSSGITLFVIGLAKKLLLANKMGEFWTLLQATNGTAAAWAGMFAYTLQIYFDFSGYSDMAIGLGRMFGFEFCVNFNFPYTAQNVTEFWRRWHISLSTWFREYVYIPLGGNRKGLPRQILNLFIVWALTGLWHGASWNFVLWGLYYAVWLCAEKLWLLKRMDRVPAVLRHAALILIVSFGWMLFYFEDMPALAAFVSRLFTLQATDVYARNTLLAYLPVFAVAAVCSVVNFRELFARIPSERVRVPLRIGVLAVLLLLCTSALAAQSYNPFIYFRF